MIGIFAILLGVYCLVGAITDWDWIMVRASHASLLEGATDRQCRVCFAVIGTISLLAGVTLAGLEFVF